MCFISLKCFRFSQLFTKCCWNVGSFLLTEVWSFDVFTHRLPPVKNKGFLTYDTHSPQHPHFIVVDRLWRYAGSPSFVDWRLQTILWVISAFRVHQTPYHDTTSAMGNKSKLNMMKSSFLFVKVSLHLDSLIVGSGSWKHAFVVFLQTHIFYFLERVQFIFFSISWCLNSSERGGTFCFVMLKLFHFCTSNTWITFVTIKSKMQMKPFKPKPWTPLSKKFLFADPESLILSNTHFKWI